MILGRLISRNILQGRIAFMKPGRLFRLFLATFRSVRYRKISLSYEGVFQWNILEFVLT